MVDSIFVGIGLFDFERDFIFRIADAWSDAACFYCNMNIAS